MNVNLDIEPRAKNVFSKEIVLPRFLNGALEDSRAFWEFATYVDVGGVRIKCITGDQHSFDQLVWVIMKDVAVFKRARLRFVSIADQIDRPLFVRFDKAPFQATRETRAAAAAESGIFYFVDDVIARQSQRLS